MNIRKKVLRQILKKKTDADAESEDVAEGKALEDESEEVDKAVTSEDKPEDE